MSSLFGDHAPSSPSTRPGRTQGWALALAGVALVAAFFEPLRFTVANWAIVQEYGYGYFIIPIVAFLVWQKSDSLRAQALRGAWGGLALIAVALLLRLLGEAGAIRLFGQYGFVVAVFGLSVCSIGWRGTRVIAVPLAMLLTMVPLPQFVLRELSQSLQLLSSELGVWLMRLAGVSVHLEGNVIDLGSYQLQVLEACSGLRYLFPLIVLGWLTAYFFDAALWQRLLIVASTVPLTIAINSLRIGLIGIAVEHAGPVMAEGLVHELEGWFMFALCIVALLAEMKGLAKMSGRTLAATLAFDLPAPGARALASTIVAQRPGAPVLAAALLLAAAGAISLNAPARTMATPPRLGFAEWPRQLPGGWRGRPETLREDVRATLALTDYALLQYVRPGEPPVGFYAAWYASQGGGESSHSPRTCLPGDGWAMTQFERRQLSAVDSPTAADGSRAPPLPAVNRVVISKGDQRQLVYYWFRQRGRSLTDEFEVKWFILRDGLLDSRSDGALLRLVTPIATREDDAAADRRLTRLLVETNARLAAFVPD